MITVERSAVFVAYAPHHPLRAHGDTDKALLDTALNRRDGLGAALIRDLNPADQVKRRDQFAQGLDVRVFRRHFSAILESVIPEMKVRPTSA